MLSWLQARFPWLRVEGLRVLALPLLVVGCALLFIVLSDGVTERETQHIDERVLLALRQPGDVSKPRGPWWVEAAARDVTALGGAPVLTLVTLGVCGFLVLRRHWRSLALVLGGTLGGTALNAVLKSLFARPRPSVVPHLTEVLSASFPSGHAMLSTIVYLTLGTLLAQLTAHRLLKLYVLGFALFLAFLIGLTRVYLGVHYPTDVLGGWLAGLAWAVLVLLVSQAAKRRSPALREETREGASE